VAAPWEAAQCCTPRTLSALHTSSLPAQAGAWSRQAHFCFPPAFKAAAAELLRMSSKHRNVGAAGSAGRRGWPFNVDMLVELLLPVMGRTPMVDWL
jgi:hypothetical protein